jgi:hypothetical protein
MTTIHDIVIGYIVGPAGDDADSHGVSTVYALSTHTDDERAARIAVGQDVLRAMYEEAGRDYDAEGGTQLIVWSDRDAATVTLDDGTELELWAGKGVIGIPDESLPDDIRVAVYGPPTALLEEANGHDPREDLQ